LPGLALETLDSRNVGQLLLLGQIPPNQSSVGTLYGVVEARATYHSFRTMGLLHDFVVVESVVTSLVSDVGAALPGSATSNSAAVISE
jgi:hypothetical protein